MVDSAIKAQVSSAHRAFLVERDGCVKQFTHDLSLLLAQIRDKYSLLLKQEESWKQRWTRQVQMLRKGDV